MGVNPSGLALIAVPVLLSLTLHEFGHARVALAFGDDTAKRLGRVSLNPLVHLDIMGTLCFLFGPVGWAKPVPVDPANLHPRRAGDIAVSLAGVGMNLLLGSIAVCALIFMSWAGIEVDPKAPPTLAGVVAFMLTYLVIINTCLIAFNLVPLFPLDGHHVLREALPARMHYGFMDWQRRFGRPLLIGLLVAPWLLRLMKSPIRFNPIGWFIGTVVWNVMALALPWESLQLAFGALKSFEGYLPY